MRFRFLTSAFVILSLILSTSAYSDTIFVPSQYHTIQAGIDAAVDGDTVMLADGNYTGEGNCSMTFEGKSIVLIYQCGPENCIIDCQDQSYAFRFNSGEDSLSLIFGLTMTGGYNYNGGAVSCYAQSSPKFFGCTFIGNAAPYS